MRILNTIIKHHYTHYNVYYRLSYVYYTLHNWTTTNILFTCLTSLQLYVTVHPSKLEPASRLILVNATQWQHYGTAGTAGALSMTWNPPVIGAIGRATCRERV